MSTCAPGTGAQSFAASKTYIVSASGVPAWPAAVRASRRVEVMAGGCCPGLGEAWEGTRPTLSAVLAGYDHLLRAAERLRWDERTLDLGADAPAFAALEAPRRAALRRMVAG